ncbi:MAG: FCD domain-containing protein [Halopseudomonas aestusnigri]
MSTTDAQRAYNFLQSDIVAGELAPGMKLKIIDLRHRYDIGAAPLREALSRLSGERLVAIHENRGFQVHEMSVADALDISRVRLHLELECLKEAVQKGDDEWEGRVVAAYHRLSRAEALSTTESTRGLQIESRNADFHAALVSACESPWLLNLRLQVFACHERYRNLSRSLSDPARDTSAEHAAIFEAAMKHDQALLLMLSREHVERTTRKAVQFITQSQ